MKRLFLFALLLAVGHMASAQRTITKPATTTSGSDANVSVTKTEPLAAFYGVKMKITKHVNGPLSVAHQTADYVMFSKGGGYEQVFNGVKKNGDWSYDPAANVVHINTGTAVQYNLKSVTASEIFMDTATETLNLKKP